MKDPFVAVMVVGFVALLSFVGWMAYNDYVVGHDVLNVDDGSVIICEIQRDGDTGRCFPAEGGRK